MKLLDETYALLEAREESLPKVAKGAGVSFEWLAKFNQRRIPNPGVQQVQAVHDYLKESPAAAA